MTGETPGRLLGAIVPLRGAAWFFKLLGPKAAVDLHAAEFEALIGSLKFIGEEPPQWQLPAGWVREPPRGMRYATLKIGEAAPKTARPRPPSRRRQPMRSRPRIQKRTMRRSRWSERRSKCR